MLIRPALAFASLALSVAPSFARGPLQSLTVGNWQGGSYTDDKTGMFSHCAALSYYIDGNSLVVAIDRQYNWSIGLYNPQWQLRTGNLFPVDIRFDSVGPFSLSGRAIANNLIEFEMQSNPVPLEAFRAAIAIHIAFPRRVLNYNLTSTSALLPALRDCVAANLQAPAAVSVAPPTPSANVASPTPPSPQPSSQANPEALAAREKLISDGGKEYTACIRTQMKEIVPYSNEGAETLAQVIQTNCSAVEQHFIELAMAIYGTSRSEVEKTVGDAVESRKKSIVADIVTFRAEMAKALQSQPKSENATDSKKAQGI
jgi:hypothetical protein